MKDIFSVWVPKIKQYSLELRELSRLCDQPWVVVSESAERIKMIFKTNGSLIVSQNGTVSDGDWELMLVANSLLLNINGVKRLYNHSFIDTGLVILKLDGSSDELFVLANENIVPDLDVQKYLTWKFGSRSESSATRSITFEKEIPLVGGGVLQIIRDHGNTGSSPVRISGDTTMDGVYRAADIDRAYEIVDNKIRVEYYIETFRQSDGRMLEVAGSRIAGISKGCPAWVNGSIAPDGEYQKGWFSKLRIKDGRVC